LRLLMIVSTVGVYPLTLYPMVSPIRDAERQNQNKNQNHPHSNISERTSLIPVQTRERPIRTRMIRTNLSIVSIVAIVTTLAVFIPGLGVWNTYNGAVSMSMLVAVFPPIVGLYLLDKTSRSWNILMYLIVILGISLSLCAFIFPLNYANELIINCMWKLHSSNKRRPSWGESIRART